MREATQEEREGVDRYIDSIAEACEDCISRQAVIELCEGWWLGHTKEDDFATEVRALPSVTPAEKVGRWIITGTEPTVYKCSECGEICCCQGRYCNDCGAKMEDEDEKR